MNKAYLLIGGNTGNRQLYLQQARNQVALQAGTIVSASQIYETAAWGKTDQDAFLNQALMIETSHPPQQLLEILLAIELDLGRLRNEKYGPRTLDIDILLYDDMIWNTNTLVLPHPALPQRRFALQPLAEIAPQLEHPLLKKDIQTILSECDDPLEVHVLNN